MCGWTCVVNGLCTGCVPSRAGDQEGGPPLPAVWEQLPQRGGAGRAPAEPPPTAQRGGEGVQVQELLQEVPREAGPAAAVGSPDTLLPHEGRQHISLSLYCLSDGLMRSRQNLCVLSVLSVLSVLWCLCCQYCLYCSICTVCTVCTVVSVLSTVVSVVSVLPLL